jgi:hypothetical protein
MRNIRYFLRSLTLDISKVNQPIFEHLCTTEAYVMLYQLDEDDQNRTVNKHVTLRGIFEIPTPFSRNRLR